MSATGLDVFDKTLQTTHIWLNEIMEVTGPDKQVAWHALGGVLRTLRDRIPLDLAAHLGAELPILVRGVFYDQWHPQAQPERYRSLDEFLDCVARNMTGIRPVNPRDAARAVFGVLSRHLPEGQIRKVRDSLPEEIRTLWQQSAAGDSDDVGSMEMGRVTAQPEQARNIRT